MLLDCVEGSDVRAGEGKHGLGAGDGPVEADGTMRGQQGGATHRLTAGSLVWTEHQPVLLTLFLGRVELLQSGVTSMRKCRGHTAVTRVRNVPQLTWYRSPGCRSGGRRAVRPPPPCSPRRGRGRAGSQARLRQGGEAACRTPRRPAGWGTPCCSALSGSCAGVGSVDLGCCCYR